MLIISSRRTLSYTFAVIFWSTHAKPSKLHVSELRYGEVAAVPLIGVSSRHHGAWSNSTMSLTMITAQSIHSLTTSDPSPANRPEPEILGPDPGMAMDVQEAPHGHAGHRWPSRNRHDVCVARTRGRRASPAAAKRRQRVHPEDLKHFPARARQAPAGGGPTGYPGLDLTPVGA